jgi:hypothetical protein
LDRLAFIEIAHGFRLNGAIRTKEKYDDESDAHENF